MLFQKHIINNFIPQVEEDRKFTRIKDSSSILHKERFIKGKFIKNGKISPVIDHLYRIFHAYEINTCSTTIWCAFKKAMFDYYKKKSIKLSKIESRKNRKIIILSRTLENQLSRRKITYQKKEFKKRMVKWAIFFTRI